MGRDVGKLSKVDSVAKGTGFSVTRAVASGFVRRLSSVPGARVTLLLGGSIVGGLLHGAGASGCGVGRFDRCGVSSGGRFGITISTSLTVVGVKSRGACGYGMGSFCARSFGCRCK